MVKKNLSSQSGAALALTLMTLALMLVLVLALSKVVMIHQRTAANYSDFKLAQNSALAAMLNAESIVYYFDLSNGMESKGPAIRRSAVSIIGNNTCNSNGWCYSTVPSWQPWEATGSSSVTPCNSYTFNTSTLLPLIDDQVNSFSRSFNTGDSTLCTQPRYMMELINANFIGRQSIIDGQESGVLVQTNTLPIIMYNNATGVKSARLYRITVKAFGRNGNTRVTLQEYLAIANNSQSRVTSDSSDLLAHQIYPISIRWLH